MSISTKRAFSADLGTIKNPQAQNTKNDKEDSPFQLIKKCIQ